MSRMENEIKALRQRIKDLEELITLMPTKGGETPSLGQGVDCNGMIVPWGTFFTGGQSIYTGETVEKIVMAVGVNGAHGKDVTDHTGPIGMVLGNNGEFISKYDSA